jgi:hypothetical protein
MKLLMLAKIEAMMHLTFHHNASLHRFIATLHRIASSHNRFIASVAQLGQATDYQAPIASTCTGHRQTGYFYSKIINEPKASELK